VIKAAVALSKSFQLGEVRTSVDAFIELKRVDRDIADLLLLYEHCDWGDVSSWRRLANDYAVRHGGLVMGRYWLDSSVLILIVTDPYSLCTTFLLSHEYRAQDFEVLRCLPTNAANDPLRLI
jgi:hypothetical protein